MGMSNGVYRTCSVVGGGGGGEGVGSHDGATGGLPGGGPGGDMGSCCVVVGALFELEGGPTQIAEMSAPSSSGA